MPTAQVSHGIITLTDDNAKGFTVIPDRTYGAMLVCEDNAIRWRADGNDPTESVGIPMAVGDTLTFTDANYHDFLRKFKIVNKAAGSNGKVQCAFFNG